ncbi:MAG: GNAT family N-acetyltransferase [Anaerolineaceae bacterium]|nr:GNAT family N-acetyltransferase [Anaerolineaceae bacterium]
MITIHKVDLSSKRDINRFVQFPFELYANHPQWVPPFISDIKMMLNPKKHPYYEHSDAEFFYAEKDGKIVGRIAALENKPFNKYHDTKDAEFYLFECVNDQEVAKALFETVIEWAKKRGLTKLVGPKGFGPLDGYGIQIEGFEHRQMMNMMNYNYPYYRDLVENLGFTKVVDFVSSYIEPQNFNLPEKVRKASEIAKKRGTFKVIEFANKRELVSWAPKIGEAYNKAFVKNWEYYPLSQNEIDFVVKNILTILDPTIFNLIARDDEVVGFVFPFPDVSAAMQRNKGKLGPLDILRLLREIKKTKWVSFNGVGILPEYQGLGGNAIMYAELEKAMHRNPQFKHSELTQVAETAVQMRKDLQNLGVKFYKNHRVYQREI